MLYYVIHLRPRRFGKSLFVDMLDSYYDLKAATQFDELFTGLYIHKTPADSRNNYYGNQYTVYDKFPAMQGFGDILI